MDDFYWLPKWIRIEIEQYEPEYNPCITLTKKYFWRGYKIYSWLWLKNMKFKFRDFEIVNSGLTFKKPIPKDADISVSYFNEI